MKKWVTKKGSVIYQVLGGRSNAFLISNQNRYILIDTGTKNRCKALLQRIKKIGVDKNKLACLVLTHTHYDHVENAASIKEKYNVPIIIHRDEAYYLRNGKNPIIQGTLLITKFMTEIFGGKLIPLFKYKPVEYDYTVDGKHDLTENGFDAYIIHTPGHSIGSMSVIVDNEIAIVGDAMFGIFKGSVFPPFAGDTKKLIESWKTLLETGCSIYLPAHGTSIDKELLQKEYEKYKKKY